MAVNLAAGMPIEELACTSHKVNAAYDGPALATVKLDAAEKNGGNRDYILRYRLAGERSSRGSSSTRARRRTSSCSWSSRPKRVTKAQIPGREYIFIVDVSGSMYGFPLDISKKLMKNLLGGLRPTDRFNVLFFSGGNWLMAEESLPATPENVRKALDLIDRQKGGGGTELLARAAARAEAAEGRGLLADRGHRDRRLRAGRGRGLRPDPQQPRQRQHVRLRHRLQRQPSPHRGHGARGHGRAVRHHESRTRRPPRRSGSGR